MSALFEDAVFEIEEEIGKMAVWARICLQHAAALEVDPNNLDPYPGPDEVLCDIHGCSRPAAFYITIAREVL